MPWGGERFDACREEGANCIEAGARGVQLRQRSLAHVASIPLERLEEKRLLVAEGVVEALPTEPKVGLQIGQRGPLVTALPEQLHGLIQHGVLVEGLGARHGDTVACVDRSVKYPSGTNCNLRFRDIDAF